MLAAIESRRVRPAAPERGERISADDAWMASEVKGRRRRLGDRRRSGREQVELITHLNKSRCGFGAGGWRGSSGGR